MLFAAVGVTPPVPSSSNGLSGYLIALMALGGVALTALATFYGVRRLNSGGIKTSTAESLWNESNAMRQDLSKRLEVAEAKVEQQTREIELARQEAITARQEAIQWQQKAMAMEADITRMKRQIATLQRKTRGGKT